MQNFNPYLNQNPYQQFQNLQQRLNQYEQPQQPQPKLVFVQNEQEANKQQVDVMSGQPTYCVFGNEIMCRQWNIEKGGVVTTRFIAKDDVINTPENIDRLKAIENMLEEINKKLTPIKRKENKDVE